MTEKRWNMEYNKVDEILIMNFHWGILNDIKNDKDVSKMQLDQQNLPSMCLFLSATLKSGACESSGTDVLRRNMETLKI
jgi:hypothetical protein